MLSTGFVAAEHATIPIGGTVAVFAQDPIGLRVTVGARLLGAAMVIGVESARGGRSYGGDQGRRHREAAEPLLVGRAPGQ